MAVLASTATVSATHNAELGTVEEVHVDGRELASSLAPSTALNRFDDDRPRGEEEYIRLTSADSSNKLAVNA
jgi:hypothetical protein